MTPSSLNLIDAFDSTVMNTRTSVRGVSVEYLTYPWFLKEIRTERRG